MRVHPVEFEVFKNLYLAIAEEMGVTLCRTGFSPNIKERLDYSCAVYDADGHTIAQGDHMPVPMRLDGPHQSLFVDAFNRGFACRIDIGDDHAIGIVETGRKLIEQGMKPRVAMRLDNGDDLRMCRRTRGFEHG